MHNREPDPKANGHATELFTGWAEEFIRESAAKDDPFFCYLAYNAVHGPLRVDESKPASAPEAWVKKALDRGVSFLRSDYVAILEHMDHNIGRLIDLLDELDIAVENTLIVFVSDNGGCTMEEGAAGGRFPRQQWTIPGRKGHNVSGRAERAIPHELERPIAPGHGLRRSSDALRHLCHLAGRCGHHSPEG